ncbi:hypothetical protein [Aliikangiella coralliicola]|uniref:Uncharacterized protein n=1 Tax=Aliikangiella coralliicola TaxID=2592383 RepID=A0A545UHF2_9GAMM|nr:hypothetical protein [Aliikangiella coralliicola]TQV88843.1 hypothetical protein FLL46_04735 [Aliikangiella coralliicola]
MKKIFVLFIVILSTNALAGGRTNWAVPSQIDIERGNGFMIYGSFGNPGGCTQSNQIYVRKDHPEYDKIYSAVLTAFTAKRHIRAYIHNCQNVSWYSATATYNTLNLNGDFNIKN